MTEEDVTSHYSSYEAVLNLHLNKDTNIISLNTQRENEYYYGG
jgi:hypothetical protein